MFDVREHCDELRCRETEWIRARRDEAIREQRRWRVLELACTAVLDERGRVDDTTLRHEGLSTRAARDTLETARRLESLPAVSAAAADGRLSDEQLSRVVQLADASTDREWARRAASMSPAELDREVRKQHTPSTEESQARREARHLRMWWTDNRGMLHLRGALADIDGAVFEETIKALADTMRPPKGRPWDSWDHRAADALVRLCHHATRTDHHADPCEPLLAPRPLFVADLPLSGPATVAGIPIADSVLEHWRANADIEPRFVDDTGALVALGRKTPILSPKLARAILLRDQACRICGRRHGLQLHHLRPRSWGGDDEAANMALVCARGPHACHPQLVPHGPYALVGNPHLVGGLRMVHLDDLTDDEADQIGLPHELRNRRPSREPRAGPHAA